MKILALSGSLRKDSSNSRLLAMTQKAFSQHRWTGFELSTLPYFDPDLQHSEDTPASVMAIRKAAAEADCLFICTPEYAHGVPGILKNALEWTFFEGTMQKPVYGVVGSAQGEHTKAQLVEILRTMDFAVADDHFLVLRGLRSAMVGDDFLRNSPHKETFERFCRTFLGGDR